MLTAEGLQPGVGGVVAAFLCLEGAALGRAFVGFTGAALGPGLVAVDRRE